MEQLSRQELRKNRLSVWLILLLPVAVIAAATFVYYTGIGLPTGTSNQGVLIQPPRDIKPVVFKGSDGKPFFYADQPFKWSLLIPGQANCLSDCRDRLYFTRQLHTALGRMQTSLRRYFLVADGPLTADTAELLARDYPELTVLYLDQAESNSLFGGIGPGPATGEPPAYFLVDPGGFLMMYYTSGHDHKQVLHDLRFLIKESGEI